MNNEEQPEVHKLVKRIEDYQAGRELEDSQREREEENEKDVHSAAEFALTQFWCSRCKKERIARGYKVIQTDWNNPGKFIAFYEALTCHRLRRRITDKFSDPYFSFDILAFRCFKQHDIAFFFLYWLDQYPGTYDCLHLLPIRVI